MQTGAWLLIALVVVLAAFLTTHLALFARVLGVMGITRLEQWLAFLFPPYLGWRSGKRVHAVLWGLLFVAYLSLRVGLAYVDTGDPSP